jgi:hypothetical protein
MTGSRGITDYAALHDVVMTVEGLLVSFRWDHDPTVYAYLSDVSDLGTSPWTGLPVDTLDDWALDLRFLLMEELDTGGVYYAPRRECYGYVLLDLDELWQGGSSAESADVETLPLGPESDSSRPDPHLRSTNEDCARGESNA